MIGHTQLILRLMPRERGLLAAALADAIEQGCDHGGILSAIREQLSVASVAWPPPAGKLSGPSRSRATVPPEPPLVVTGPGGEFLAGYDGGPIGEDPVRVPPWPARESAWAVAEQVGFDPSREPDHQDTKTPSGQKSEDRRQKAVAGILSPDSCLLPSCRGGESI